MTAEISDYKGFDLALGSVFGVRWFTVDRWGRLRGRHYDHIWTPGENVAICRKSEEGVFGNLIYRYSIQIDRALLGYPPGNTAPTTTTPGRFTRHRPISEEAVEARIEHAVPHSACTCGFYAFAEGCDDGQYARDAGLTAMGVIECYGRTILGTKGLRTEKARIVGLRTKDEAVKSLYPDAQVYDKRNDLLAAFDLVQRYTRNPENDPDFWTRP